MENYYSSAARFPVGVDCIIFGLVGGSLCLLLTRRAFEPAKGEWSLMGGFVDADESVDDAARRILRQLTGLENIYMEQVGAFGEVDRDPGDRVVSVAYFALLGASEYDSERLEAHAAEWVDLAELPDLCFDHPRMIRAALEQLRAKISLNPISFNLLPEMFTLSQLQALHPRQKHRQAEFPQTHSRTQLYRAHGRYRQIITSRSCPVPLQYRGLQNNP